MNVQHVKLGDIIVNMIALAEDNYTYMVVTGDKAVVIDPAEAQPVISYADSCGWNITHILNTHHHYDHVAGNSAIKRVFDSWIIGSTKNLIPSVDYVVSDNESFTINGLMYSCMATPGHTNSSVCWYAPEINSVFTGDTLLTAGCGRVEKNQYKAMWDSLCKICMLPEDTYVFSGHEYTLDNLDFALTIDPHHEPTLKHLHQVEHLMANGLFCQPSTILQEKTANIFLRSSDPLIRPHLRLDHPSDLEVFTRLRQRKDRF